MSWTNQTKTGQGWIYNSITIAYEAATDSVSHLAITYDGLGTTTSWTNQTITT